MVQRPIPHKWIYVLSVVGSACLSATVSAAPVKVTVASWWGLDRLGEVVAAFQKEHPDIELVYEVRPGGSSYHEKIVLEAASGVGPDLYFVDAYYFGQFFKQGVLRDLSEFIKADGLDLRRFGGGNALEMGYGGRIYALPMWFPDNPNLYVNKNLAQEAGIDIPEWGTPAFDTWRWDDLRRAAKKLTRVNADGTVAQWGIQSIGTAPMPTMFFVWQNGGELYRETAHIEETETLIDQAPAVEAYEFLAKLILEDNVAPRPSVGPGEATWMNGRAGFLIGWNVLSSYQPAPFDWTLIPIPWQTRRVTKVGGNSWAMSKNSRNPKEAWTVLKWFTTNPTALRLMAKVGSLTSYDPVRTVLPYATGKQRLLWGTLLDRASGNVTFRPWWFGSRNVSAVMSALNEAGTKVLNGQEPARSALAVAAQKIRAAIQP